MTTDEMGARYYGVPDVEERAVPDYVAAIAGDDEWSDDRRRVENEPGGRCAVVAVLVLVAAAWPAVVWAMG